MSQQECRRPMRRLHAARRWVAGLVVAGLLAFGAGCYGSFPLTHLVYSVNGQIKPGVLRQLTFWLFIILPVYEISALADVVILNLLEFWTGADLGGFGQVEGEAGLEFAMQPAPDGRTAAVTITRRGEAVAQAQFVRVSDDLCTVHNMEGRLLGRAVRTPEGGLRLESADGTVVAALSADECAGLLASSQ